MQYPVTFPSGTVQYNFTNCDVACMHEVISGYCDMQQVIFVTDEHIAQLYPQFFTNHKCLVLPASEQSKDVSTVATQAQALLKLEATRGAVLIGVGGGMITDFTGFLASVYMRGVQFGFIPTSLLGMVDASIGGKNGVNLGLYKNILGSITQPAFIIYNTSFLATLPASEWSNGFAEIIKYACIFDAELFHELEAHDLSFYQNGSKSAIEQIIQRCVAWKNKTVLEDESEKGIRKLLNFGHTAGHAIENMYYLPHGQAVGIGMVIACTISSGITGLAHSVSDELKELLRKYHLPDRLDIDVDKVIGILKMDKKRNNNTIDYILLESIGKAVIKPLPFQLIEHALTGL